MEVIAHNDFKDSPRIKCNINKGQFGKLTKIYHLLMDQQYDITKINGEGKFFASTVLEAEQAGFRRTFRWRGEAL